MYNNRPKLGNTGPWRAKPGSLDKLRAVLGADRQECACLPGIGLTGNGPSAAPTVAQVLSTEGQLDPRRRRGGPGDSEGQYQNSMHLGPKELCLEGLWKAFEQYTTVRCCKTTDSNQVTVAARKILPQLHGCYS